MVVVLGCTEEEAKAVEDADELVWPTGTLTVKNEAGKMVWVPSGLTDLQVAFWQGDAWKLYNRALGDNIRTGEMADGWADRGSLGPLFKWIYLNLAQETMGCVLRPGFRNEPYHIDTRPDKNPTDWLLVDGRELRFQRKKDCLAWFNRPMPACFAPHPKRPNSYMLVTDFKSLTAAQTVERLCISPKLMASIDLMVSACVSSGGLMSQGKKMNPAVNMDDLFQERQRWWCHNRRKLESLIVEMFGPPKEGND